MKRCCTCKESKPLEDFGNNKSSPDGLQRRCLVCSRVASSSYYSTHKDRAVAATKSWQSRNPEKLRQASRRWRESYPQKMSKSKKVSNLRFFYGLSLEQYELMLEKGCQICGSHENPHVDHDHSCCPSLSRGCGTCVRGLLCQPCNLALGLFKDDPGLLQAAAQYLSEYNARKSLLNKESTTPSEDY